MGQLQGASVVQQAQQQVQLTWQPRPEVRQQVRAGRTAAPPRLPAQLARCAATAAPGAAGRRLAPLQSAPGAGAAAEPAPPRQACLQMLQGRTALQNCPLLCPALDPVLGAVLQPAALRLAPQQRCCALTQGTAPPLVPLLLLLLLPQLLLTLHCLPPAAPSAAASAPPWLPPWLPAVPTAPPPLPAAQLQLHPPQPRRPLAHRQGGGAGRGCLPEKPRLRVGTRAGRHDWVSGGQGGGGGAHAAALVEPLQKKTHCMQSLVSNLSAAACAGPMQPKHRPART